MLDSERAFISRFAEDARSRVIRESEALHASARTCETLCAEPRREQTGIPFTKRIVESRTLEPTRCREAIHRHATEYLRDVSKNSFKTIEALIAENPNRKFTESQSNAILVFQAITLQQSFSSSPAASIQSLLKRRQRFPTEAQATSKLIEMAGKVKSAKMELLSNILRETPKEQALIFCLERLRHTRSRRCSTPSLAQPQFSLATWTRAAGMQLSPISKQDKLKYLVATDAAAEGLNLQNCCLMFNYDLHWNPMKIEQRIGRIHRFKQDRDVTVFNLAVKDTIDDYVLHILYQKIDLFTMTIGKMETVFAELKEGT